MAKQINIGKKDSPLLVNEGSSEFTNFLKNASTQDIVNTAHANQTSEFEFRKLYGLSSAEGGGLGVKQSDVFGGGIDNIVGGSSEIRKDQVGNKSDAGTLLQDLEDVGGTFNKTISTSLEGINKQIENIQRISQGNFTGQETGQILGAGQEAGGRFGNLIAEAQEAKRKGLPKALVGAGQRGGLQSTQFAGVAATEPIVGESFFGAGGELSNIASEFDRNIQNIEIAKQNAIASAESAAKKAIRTGAKEDLALAQDAFTTAQNAFKTQQDLIEQRIDLLNGGGEPITVGKGATLVSPSGDVLFRSSEDTDEALSVADAAKLGVPFGTTQGEAAELGIIPSGSNASDFEIRTIGNQLLRVNPDGSTEVIFEGEEGDDPFTTQQKFQNTFSFRKEVVDNSGDFIKIRDSFARIQASIEKPSAAGDLALIFNYMKILDPGSVVRESEFATAANAAGVPTRARNLWNKFLYGTRLGAPTNEEVSLVGNISREQAKSEAGNELQSQRDDFVSTAGRLFNSQLKIQRQAQDDARSIAVELGLDPNTAVPDLGKGFNLEGEVLNDDEFQFLRNKFPDMSDEEIHSLGKISVDGDTNKAIARTDRHNNPTAFTTDIAKQAGLKEGVDFEIGDKFPEGNFKTARLLGDPIDTTIKVIDKIGFFTQGGKQRWTHTALSSDKWNSLSRDEKSKVIKDMYQKEGNSGLLNNFFA